MAKAKNKNNVFIEPSAYESESDTDFTNNIHKN